MTARRGFQPFPPSRPRPATGGIKARRARGSIGESWWSRQFVDVLESFALGSRMTRGRSYARAGQVVALEVHPGKATAAVQGSRARPYRVSIGLAPFPEPVWARVEVALAEQAIHSAQLLAGELPPELAEVFAAAGAPLFPSGPADLDMSCSCPDWEVPCKHLAATLYLLAEAFDADPFQILLWRGRSRDVLLDRLRALRQAPGVASGGGGVASGGGGVASGGRGVASGGAAVAPDGAAAGACGAGRDASTPGSPRAVLSGIGETPLADCLDRFWMPPQPLPTQPPSQAGNLVAGTDLLLRQLPLPGAALGGPALLEALGTYYARFARPRQG